MLFRRRGHLLHRFGQYSERHSAALYVGTADIQLYHVHVRIAEPLRHAFVIGKYRSRRVGYHRTTERAHKGQFVAYERLNSGVL